MGQFNALAAFETYAQYNLNLEAGRLPGTSHQEGADVQQYHLFLLDWINHELKTACQAPEGFDRFFDIHLRYPKSLHYTYLLLLAIFDNPKISSTQKSVLCHDLARYETVEAVGLNTPFDHMVHLLCQYVNLKNKSSARKQIELVDALFPARRETAGKMELWGYYCNRLLALNDLGEYQQALDMASEIGGEYRDNTVLNNLMIACIHLERFDEAVQYGQAAASVGGDDLDFLWLGRAYLGKQDYDKAVESAKSTIWYIQHRKDRTTYEFKGETIEKRLGNADGSYAYVQTFKLADPGVYGTAEVYGGGSRLSGGMQAGPRQPQ